MCKSGYVHIKKKKKRNIKYNNEKGNVLKITQNDTNIFLTQYKYIDIILNLNIININHDSTKK